MSTSVSPAVLVPSIQLTNAIVAYIIGTLNAQTLVKRTVITSTVAGAVTFTMYRVPNGGSALGINILVNARSIPGFGTDLVPELANMVLNFGESINVIASAAASLNITSSGYIVT
jgi:hypothetical protein